MSQDLVTLVFGRLFLLDVSAGVAPLIELQDVEGLRKMYDLLDRVDALEALKLAFAKSVEVRFLDQGIFYTLNFT